MSGKLAQAGIVAREIDIAEARVGKAPVNNDTAYTLSRVLFNRLGKGSGLVGKKSAAFLKKTNPIFINKALSNLMKAMEKEGMLINWSEILLSAPQAEALGKRIGA